MSRLTADVEGFRFFLSFGFSELIRFVILLLPAFPLCSILYFTHFCHNLPAAFLGVAVYRFDKRVHPAFQLNSPIVWGT